MPFLAAFLVVALKIKETAFLAINRGTTFVLRVKKFKVLRLISDCPLVEIFDF